MDENAGVAKRTTASASRADGDSSFAGSNPAPGTPEWYALGALCSLCSESGWHHPKTERFQDFMTGEWVEAHEFKSEKERTEHGMLLGVQTCEKELFALLLEYRESCGCDDPELGPCWLCMQVEALKEKSKDEAANRRI
jgi:hypothetical protein